MDGCAAEMKVAGMLYRKVAMVTGVGGGIGRATFLIMARGFFCL
jgi:NAD(P)-dependent dehydrogenase (short-subunit alcohol dehydrogenase family)